MQSVFDLSQFLFTGDSDLLNSDITVFNPLGSTVNTLKGDDQVIGNVIINGDFGFEPIPQAELEELILDSIDINSLINEAQVRGDGIKNRGTLNTNQGGDLVQGSSTTNLFVTAEATATAIAIANNGNATSIANAFAAVDFQALANGIDNVRGIINTNSGNDSIGGEIQGSINAIANATADASAIVGAIATMPMSDGLIAFAEAMAISFANATIIATGINNRQGKITTGPGNDTIRSTANTNAISMTDAVTSALSMVPEENRDFAQATANAFADAFAQATDIAIAIDNSLGLINTGDDDDQIIATSDQETIGESIAINNIGGHIRTGNGDDRIIARGNNGLLSYGILGGKIATGDGKDRVIASKFGGNVEIYLGEDNDYVEGFGTAQLFGGNGFDAVNLTIENLTDLDSVNIVGQNAFFSLDGMLLRTHEFEQFIFANGQKFNINNLPFLGSNDDDFFQGRETNDFMNLRSGDDVAYGRAGSDEILGQEGNDILSGDAGNDTLSGGLDDDLLFGGLGKDILDSGLGRDILQGGAGNDHFVISGQAAERDLILDYQDGFDKLKLTDGLTFGSITINQRGHNTEISDRVTHETYTILLGIDASHIDASDFV